MLQVGKGSRENGSDLPAKFEYMLYRYILRSSYPPLSPDFNILIPIEFCKAHTANRHAVVKLIFADELANVRREGFRTPKTTQRFRAFSGFSG